jgi:hypothetical protein
LTNSDARVRFLENADYASHLSNPQELAADSIVSIAVYPEALARKIFAKPWKWRFVGEAKDMTDEALAEVRRHLNKAYGYELMEQMMPNLRSHYWASMIHHAKLRWALLAVHDL